MIKLVDTQKNFILFSKIKKKYFKIYKICFGNSWSSALIIASNKPKIWHNLRVDAHSEPLKELKKILNSTISSAEKLNKFYNGAIEVKPSYWRKIIK